MEVFMSNFFNFIDMYYYPIINSVIMFEIAFLLGYLAIKLLVDFFIFVSEFVKNKRRDKRKKEFLSNWYKLKAPSSFAKCVTPLKLEFDYIYEILSKIDNDNKKYIYEQVEIEKEKLFNKLSFQYSNDSVIELTNKQSKMFGLLNPYMQALFVTFSDDMKMFLVSDLEHRYYVSFYRNHEFDRDDSWYIHFLDVENNVVICDESSSFIKVLEKINNYYSVRGIVIEVKNGGADNDT